MTDTLTIQAQEQMVTGAGGLNLLVRSWQPVGTPRAVVAIVPGFNSHGGYYGWVAEQLVANDLAVYTVDLRGRGRSDGERYFVESFSEYLADVSTMMAQAKSRHPELPFFLLGHSAGGVISCMYTLEHQDELAGLICESFAFQVPAPDFALAVIKGLSHLAPHAHVLRLKIDDFSRDPQVLQAMHADPFIADEVQPTKTVAEMVRADEHLKQSFPQFRLPVFILHGSADKVTRPEGSQLFYDNAGSADKTLKLYEGHAHDLLNDFDKEVVIADIKSWINGRLPAR